MSTKQKEKTVNKQLRTAITNQLKDEIGKSRKKITSFQKSLKELRTKSRPLVKQVDDLEKKALEIQKELVAEERKYSSYMTKKFVLEKAAVNISEEETKDLNKLSRLYKAFKVVIPPDDPNTDEPCLWSSCWTCSTECAVCSKCGLTSYNN